MNPSENETNSRLCAPMSLNFFGQYIFGYDLDIPSNKDRKEIMEI